MTIFVIRNHAANEGIERHVAFRADVMQDVTLSRNFQSWRQKYSWHALTDWPGSGRFGSFLYAFLDSFAMNRCRFSALT